MNPARRTDWKAIEMPDPGQPLELRLEFSRIDMARLCFGVIPNRMEEKWFVFFEQPWLYLHRSWTGICVYQLRFTPSAQGAELSEVRLNLQEPAPDPLQEADRLKFLLESILKRNFRQADTRFISDFLGDARENSC